MSEEIWEDIEGYNGWYQVSNMGRVRSWKGHRGHNKRECARLLKSNKLNTGRFYVDLCINGKKNRHLIHRLVAETYIPNPNNYPFVLHDDDDPENNHVNNLKWGTHSENTLDMLRNTGSKLTKNDIIQIRNTYKLGCFTQQEIADAWNVSNASINRIVNYNAWVNI